MSKVKDTVNTRTTSVSVPLFPFLQSRKLAVPLSFVLSFVLVLFIFPSINLVVLHSLCVHRLREKSTPSN